MEKPTDHQPLVAYTGAIGNRNLGDRAIYEASKDLFSELKLIPECEGMELQHGILGGGTLLPIVTTENSETYNFHSERVNYCIGIGVLDPNFHSLSSSSIGDQLRKRLAQTRYGTSMISIVSSINNSLDKPLNFGTIPQSEDDYSSIKRDTFNSIGVRGPLSKKYLQKEGIDCEIVGDTALYLESKRYKNATTNKIAISIRSDDCRKWGDDRSYEEEIIDFCNSLSGYEFVILPMNPRDIGKAEKLHNNIKKSVIVDYSQVVDLDGLLNTISECDLVIGERLHANVLAASCYVPFISIEYDPKVRDFSRSMNMEDTNILINDVSKDSLEMAFDKAIGRKDEIRKKVSEYRQRLNSESRKIKEDIQNTV